jgi:magnesium-transporting ATPase (P-type)
MSPTSHPMNWYRGESPHLHLVPALYTMSEKWKRKRRKPEITNQRNLKKRLSENTKIYFLEVGSIYHTSMFTRFPVIVFKIICGNKCSFIYFYLFIMWCNVNFFWSKTFLEYHKFLLHVTTKITTFLQAWYWLQLFCSSRLQKMREHFFYSSVLWQYTR